MPNAVTSAIAIQLLVVIIQIPCQWKPAMDVGFCICNSSRSRLHTQPLYHNSTTATKTIDVNKCRVSATYSPI